MDSVSSVNPVSNLSSLFQTLGTESPQLSAILGSSKVQSALQNASPQDILQLSNQALQFQQIGSLFTNPVEDSSTTARPGELLTQALQASLTATSPTQSTAVASSTSTSQSAQIAALFGVPSTSDPLFSAFG